MFTGIITDVGQLARRCGNEFTIRSGYDAAGIALGASIACDGCCLTVTSVAPDGKGEGSHFTLDVSNETLSKTTLGDWQEGRAVNLERALKAGEELGGHIVSGHVDGVATLISVAADGASRRLRFQVPSDLSRYIAAKGSVALNGTSLTVNEVKDDIFGVNLIPHSLTMTNWDAKKPGDRINLEIDLFARYVARLMESSS